MRRSWRRLRGAVGMGLTWALGWAPIGAVLGSLLWVLHSPPVGIVRLVVVNATTLAVLGFAGGMIFSTVLRLAAGHRTFGELTLPGFAVWGAAGGAVLGALAVTAGLWGAAGLPMLGVAVAGAATVLGAGSAACTLALARRAEARGRLEAPSGRSDPGIPEDAVRPLIG